MSSYQATVLQSIQKFTRKITIASNKTNPHRPVIPMDEFCDPTVLCWLEFKYSFVGWRFKCNAFLIKAAKASLQMSHCHNRHTDCYRTGLGREVDSKRIHNVWPDWIGLSLERFLFEYVSNVYNFYFFVNCVSVVLTSCISFRKIKITNLKK